MSTSNTQTYAIVFADIVESTRMYESLGDTLAKKLITELEEAIAQVVIACGGHVVEIIGDEVMSRYDNPSSAVIAACRIHERVELYAEQSGMPMAARIGLHYGPAIFEAGRMYGDSVNVAARMAAIAQAKQIITTEQVVEALPDELRLMARQFDKVKVKGKVERMIIYDLLWQKEDVTFIHTAPITQSLATKTLILEYNNKTYKMPPTQGSVGIGRDPKNELVVNASSASRSHAVLEYYRGKYVLKDISTNGTYLTTQNQQSLYLRRETIPLLGHGMIGLGEPVSDNNKHLISYRFQESK
ncbi:MAG: adenylate/guanylate cyclase domain-containing protein [Candidatus Thiodiazotropha lotti]|uniref:Adenylate cyclase n=1 Tax=Candidatus Thiodiazotropha endoloripes TaxID=1818881 RepID=A0A1E2ULQ4_9GAMM|nr:adenylate/guanylate cyclase domain-containing protein [Candidatus Thiodiazotropha endoloripes]MCG7898122.1 adenylate/guanylate cyclase domain-containing protein [Candidatus Thiodiazotropha weberae]MCG7991834.1 adenylate/guanylate cyclase domain-containing protein [Candidatus Thiodiazotropha lotti]MCG7904597.1 adenylate/guanylate cyclase domain-containing protein [Candidatus Thiodiazotropha weberae]MCG8000437.1 adenylate/guanylate cyclase domain-containing protein [Candidatus Thiodiazotropha 